MKDVTERKDLDFIVKEFYIRVLADDKIAPVFTSEVKINWEIHLPIISDFWENILWGGNKYQDNLLQKHLDFNDKIPLNKLHLESCRKVCDRITQYILYFSDIHYSIICIMNFVIPYNRIFVY